MLEPLKESIKKYNIFSFDCETYSEYNYFYMCSIRSNNMKRVYFNKLEAINFFISIMSNDNIVFTTNLQFDIIALFEDTEYLECLFPILRGSDFISVEFKLDNKKLLFLDTYNYARFSVATLGKIIGMEKMKKPSFLGSIPKNKKELHYLINYNLQDSLITLKFGEFLQNAYNELGIGLRYTIASVSMALFRKKYLSVPIYSPNKEEIDFFKQGYYGGRTEAFYRGFIKDVNYYDVNSLYPYCYINEFPNPNYMEKINRKTLNKLDFEGMCKVKIKCPFMHIPFLPYRYKKLLFPYGEWEGYYTNLELRYALKLGYKIKILEGYIFTKTFRPFEQYAKDLYKMRMDFKDKNNPYELPIKISLNSLYGKFGQHYTFTELMWFNNLTDEKFTEFLKKGYDVDIVKNIVYITKNSDKIPKFINPIFCAYVTGYARIKLFEYMKEIGFENVLYCDTDSILTKQNIKTGKDLGEMKLEYKIKEGIIIKPKMYAFIGINEKNNYCHRIKCKGIPSFMFKCYGDFLRFLDKPQIDFIKFCKFKESLKSKNYKTNQKITVNKKLILNDIKRLWKDSDFKTFQISKPIEVKIK